MNRKLLLFASLVVCSLLFTACGKDVLKTEKVEGTVTLDGAPLADCTVFFTAQGEGTNGVGRTDSQGKYKLQTVQGAADAGTTPGTYAVHFNCQVVVTPEETDSEGNVTKEEVTKSAIPAKYNDAKTSGFTATVQKGANTFDFDLTSK